MTERDCLVSSTSKVTGTAIIRASSAREAAHKGLDEGGFKQPPPRELRDLIEEAIDREPMATRLYPDVYADRVAAALEPLIEAVRQEEREKAAQIAERMHGVGNDVIAARIREQGKGHGRG